MKRSRPFPTSSGVARRNAILSIAGGRIFIFDSYVACLDGSVTAHVVLSLEGKTAMADYRCYFVNNLDQIQAAQILECSEDSEALSQASELAEAQSLTVEIWTGARLVGRVPQPAAIRRPRPERLA